MYKVHSEYGRLLQLMRNKVPASVLNETIQGAQTILRLIAKIVCIEEEKTRTTFPAKSLSSTKIQSASLEKQEGATYVICGEV